MEGSGGNESIIAASTKGTSYKLAPANILNPTSGKYNQLPTPLPINRLFTVLLQVRIGFAEMVAAEKTTIGGERRWMRGF